MKLSWFHDCDMGPSCKLCWWCLLSLLLCGVLAVLMENYEQAEIFFEDATCLEPTNVVAWSLLGLIFSCDMNTFSFIRRFSLSLFTL